MKWVEIGANAHAYATYGIVLFKGRTILSSNGNYFINLQTKCYRDLHKMSISFKCKTNTYLMFVLKFFPFQVMFVSRIRSVVSERFRSSVYDFLTDERFGIREVQDTETKSYVRVQSTCEHFHVRSHVNCN